MRFDPSFIDFEKSDSAIGIALPNVGEDASGWTIKVVTPIPFIAVDGGSYVLMPDGKVYPND